MKEAWLRVQPTVVINAVDEANADLSVIVGHQDNVKQLLAVWIELPKPRVDVHQGLFSRRDQRTGCCIMTFRRGVPTLTELHLLSNTFLKRRENSDWMSLSMV